MSYNIYNPCKEKYCTQCLDTSSLALLYDFAIGYHSLSSFKFTG